MHSRLAMRVAGANDANTPSDAGANADAGVGANSAADSDAAAGVDANSGANTRPQKAQPEPATDILVDRFQGIGQSGLATALPATPVSASGSPSRPRIAVAVHTNAGLDLTAINSGNGSGGVTEAAAMAVPNPEIPPLAAPAGHAAAIIGQ